MSFKARFAGFYPPYDGEPAFATYYIEESDHATLPVHGNVSACQIIEAGEKVPETPSYDVWAAKRAAKMRAAA